MKGLNTFLSQTAVRRLCWLLLALPAAYLWWSAASDRLGANPAEALIRGLGDWTLKGLWLTLLITPLRHWKGWHALARWRRGLGLWTFAYACLHMLAYIWLDMGWDLAAVGDDLIKRPFITLGMVSILCLLPLALTSFDRAVAWLGGQRWRQLHRLVYLVGVLVLLHFYWMRAGKRNFTEVYVYASVFLFLMAWRVWHRRQRRR